MADQRANGTAQYVVHLMGNLRKGWREGFQFLPAPMRATNGPVEMTQQPSSHCLQWNKNQKTWFIDISGVGRYCIRRSAARMPFSAYLNGERLIQISIHSNVEIVKQHTLLLIEERLR